MLVVGCYNCCFDFTVSFQYTIREAAKAAGLWEKAPYMEDIPPDVMTKFYDAVSIKHMANCDVLHLGQNVSKFSILLQSPTM